MEVSMRNVKKYFGLAVLLAVMVLAFTACSDDITQVRSVYDRAPAVTGLTATVEKPKIVITWASVDGDTNSFWKVYQVAGEDEFINTSLTSVFDSATNTYSVTIPDYTNVGYPPKNFSGKAFKFGVARNSTLYTDNSTTNYTSSEMAWYEVTLP
jgi:hypothetical protein